MPQDAHSSSACNKHHGRLSRNQTMSIERQLPKLYLRGAIATQTMKNLTKSEVQFIDDLIKEVMEDPGTAQTITGVARNYQKIQDCDKDAALQEISIAIWRATAQLCFHHTYTYKCEACNQSQYLTKRGKPSPILKRDPVCPNCGCVKIKNPGDTTLIQGSYILAGDFQNSYINFGPDQKSPECESPIFAIAGGKRYEDPNGILNDPKQRKKYFKQYIWNYFRQQINENKRKEHDKKPKTVTGIVHEVILEEFLALCAKHSVKNSINESEHCYHLSLYESLKSTPSFTIELETLIRRAEAHGILMVCEDSTAMIEINHDSAIIESKVAKPQHVMVLNSNSKSDRENGGDLLDQCEHDYRGHKMNEDHVDTIESSDTVEWIRDQLPDGQCRKIYDIMSGVGDTYSAFIDRGFKEGTIAHIATFLGIPPRMVSNCKQQIRHHMLAAGLVPQ